MCNDCTTPKDFWGIDKRDFQDKLHLVLSFSENIIQLIAPEDYLRIDWRHVFHLCSTKILVAFIVYSQRAQWYVGCCFANLPIGRALLYCMTCVKLTKID